MIKLINILNEMEIADPSTGLTAKRIIGGRYFSLYLYGKWIYNPAYSNGVLDIVDSEEKIGELKHLFDKHGIPYEENRLNYLTISPESIDNWNEAKSSLNEMEIADPFLVTAIKHSDSEVSFTLEVNGISIGDFLHLDKKTAEKYKANNGLPLPDHMVNSFTSYEYLEDNGKIIPILEDGGVPYEIMSYPGDFSRVSISSEYVEIVNGSLNEMEIADPTSTLITATQPYPLKNSIYYNLEIFDNNIQSIIKTSFDGIWLGEFIHGDEDDEITKDNFRSRVKHADNSEELSILEDNEIPYEKIPARGGLFYIVIPSEYVEIINGPLNEMEIEDPESKKLYLEFITTIEPGDEGSHWSKYSGPSIDVYDILDFPEGEFGDAISYGNGYIIEGEPDYLYTHDDKDLIDHLESNSILYNDSWNEYHILYNTMIPIEYCEFI